MVLPYPQEVYCEKRGRGYLRGPRGGGGVVNYLPGPPEGVGKLEIHREAARQLSLKSDSVLAIWSPWAGVFGWAVEVISRVTAMSNELSCRLKRVEAGGRAEVRELGCSLKGWESLVHLPADSGRLKGFSDSKKIFKF